MHLCAWTVAICVAVITLAHFGREGGHATQDLGHVLGGVYPGGGKKGGGVYPGPPEAALPEGGGV